MIHMFKLFFAFTFHLDLTLPFYLICYHIACAVCTCTSPLHSLFSGNAATGKAQEKLIGRMFLPLQKIALEGEDRALPLDPKRLNGASVLIHLSVKGSQVCGHFVRDVI